MPKSNPSVAPSSIPKTRSRELPEDDDAVMLTLNPVEPPPSSPGIDSSVNSTVNGAYPEVGSPLKSAAGSPPGGGGYSQQPSSSVGFPTSSPAQL